MSLRHRLRRFFLEEQPDLLRLARLARYELDAATIHLRGLASPAQRRTLAELRRQRGLRVQIAGGLDKQSGWINVDAATSADVRLDLRKGLPFADGSVALIFCEHFLDHLAYPHASRRVLRECVRVLEPNGRLRLVLHDAERIARAFADRDADFFRDAVAPGIPIAEAVNLLFRFDGFHQFLYDFPVLESHLLEAGFAEVIRSSFRGSVVPELNLDVDHPNRWVQSLYVEAIR
jgi:predicted SAM-dependent methyltransferase